MANQEHLAILKQGAEVWNQWREKNSLIQPDLNHVSLGGRVDYSQINFSGANLNFSGFTFANLSGANLNGATLMGAYLMGASLRGASLCDAQMSVTNLDSADLTDVDMSNATLDYTVLANVDLRRVKGLESVKHHRPSAIDIRTVYRSQGNIPETFLRGVGVPDSFITYARSLVGRPIEYFSCFISYSSRDEAFVKRLYADLQSNDVRCWFAPEDLKIGDKLRPSIDESIYLYDKLLLVLSHHSVMSQWVEHEVETALEKERRENRTVLFPIRLDKTVMEIEGGWPALIRNTRNIGDFSRWKRHETYQRAFERLLRDLKAESKR
jgi:TIR domain/Pentapeptide repeats (8 copies)